MDPEKQAILDAVNNYDPTPELNAVKLRGGAGNRRGRRGGRLTPETPVPTRTFGGQEQTLPFQQLSGQSAENLAKGAAVAPFTAAPDILGLVEDYAKYGVDRTLSFLTGEDFSGTGEALFGESISGNPIRELVGLDPESGTGMVGEVFAPVGTAGKAAVGLAEGAQAMGKFAGKALADAQWAAPFFHGGAASFNRWDTTKMGSGTGGQREGWGAYFATSQDEADDYKNMLSNVTIQHPELPPEVLRDAGKDIWNSDYTVEEASEFVRDPAFWEQQAERWAESGFPEYAELIRQAKPWRDAEYGGGFLYEAEIPDEMVAQMPDRRDRLMNAPKVKALSDELGLETANQWNPGTTRPPEEVWEVQEALAERAARLGQPYESGDAGISDLFEPGGLMDFYKFEGDVSGPSISGETINSLRRQLAEKAPDMEPDDVLEVATALYGRPDAAASILLDSRGVPGIRYSGEQDMNVVVFNPERALARLKRNGEEVYRSPDFTPRTAGDLREEFLGRDDEFWDIADEGDGSTFRKSGYRGTQCTGYACEIQEKLGRDRVKVLGFDAGDNPEALTGQAADGHDFAVVDDRYIVDPWVSDVEDMGKGVYDLQDPADAAKIRELYGDPKTWKPAGGDQQRYYRAPGFEGGAPPGWSANDIIESEAERGWVDPDKITPEIAKKLEGRPAEDLMWVAPNREYLWSEFGPDEETGWRGLIEDKNTIEDITDRIKDEGWEELPIGADPDQVLMIRKQPEAPTTDQTNFLYNDDVPMPHPPGSQRIIDVGMELNDQAMEAWGGQVPDMSLPENREKAIDAMFNEAMASYEKRPDMAGWYKDNLARAMAHAAKLHPELATDPQAEGAFKLIMAITSNGQEVPLNAKLTNQYYQEWRRTGKFPIKGSGKEADAMRKSFTAANKYIDREGWDAFNEFLDTDFTVKELKQMGFKISGENVDTMVKGSAIFGPKIGNGFLQNLRGNYDPATFDRWWTRTWGRHTGTLISDPVKIGDQLDKFLDEVDDLTAADLRAYGVTRQQLEDHPEEAAIMLYNQFAKGGFDDADKTPINNKARNLAKSLTNVVDAPGGGKDRNNMRAVILGVRDRMRENGIMVDTADVQALLWYTEKDLYAKMGAKTNTETVDYATVWEQLAGAPKNALGSAQ